MTRAQAVGGRLLTRLLPTLGVVAALALASGCGGTGTPSPAAGGAAASPSVVVRPATLHPGQPVPAPKGKTVLTLTGLVSAKNSGSSVVLDQAAIDQLGLVQVTVYEPWIKQRTGFRGVWLNDLLAVAGAADSATTIRMTALDDYRVELKIADVRGGGILLATKAGDGSAMPVSDGGPTRIVYLDGLPAGANADQWIWSLKTIEIR
jgi:hypothetical protein